MSDEDDEVGPVALVASALIVLGVPLLFTLFIYTGLFSQVLPLLCDPAVELDSTAVEGPPAGAEHVFEDGVPYADWWIKTAVEDGIYRRCSTENAIQIENLVVHGPLEQRDTFYYRHGDQWYRVESHIAVGRSQF